MSQLERAHTLFELKSLDKAQRIVEGFASTPKLDRQGDVLLSRGAEFDLPMPLLWQHQQDKPIGTVIEAQVSDRGIRIKAQIAKNVLPYIDEAWALIQAGLVRGFSVGWKPLEAPTRLKNGGLQFSRWMWGETSAVTIPANATATIDLIKSLDAPSRVASTQPAVVGRSSKVIPMTPNEQPIAAQIEAVTATLNTKAARLQELAVRDGTDAGLEAAEVTERDALTDEVDTLSTRLKSFRAIESAQAAMARPVNIATPNVNTKNVQPYTPHVQVRDNLPPGIEFARYLICRMAALKSGASPLELAKHHYPDNPRIQWLIKSNDWLQKDNIPAGTTTDATFAGPLVQPTNLATEFVEYLRPKTIIGKLTNVTRTPFNVRITGQTSGATGYWVGQGQAKPLTRFNFGAQTLGYAKGAAIVVITDELARFSSPSAEERVRNEVTAALRERFDIDFTDPSKAAVANVSPASITNGVMNLNDSGNTLANVTTDIAQFYNAMIGVNIDLAECFWIMPTSVALQLSLMRDSFGALAFPTISITGGTFQGLPVIVSQYLVFGHTPANNKVILVHGPSIALADDGGFSVDVSREASLEMDDQPVMASSSTAGSPSGPTGSALVSMFQTNSIAIRAERYINWARLRTGAVVWMDDVRWAA